MKKCYLIFIAAVFLAGYIPVASAMVHVVQVQDFSFSPSSMVVNNGDTITWTWVNGSHTTTSTSVPTGAATWDMPINATSPFFMYVTTVAGNYTYHCTPHASMGMTGSFTVVEATSIAELTAPVLFLGKSYVRDGYLTVEYIAPAIPVSFQLFDITGHRVYDEWLDPVSSGEQKHSIPVASLPAGIYILNLMTSNEQRTKRVVID